MGKSILKFFDKLTAKPTLEGHQMYFGKYHDGDVECEYVSQNDEKIFDGPFKYEYKYGSMFSDKGYEKAEGTFKMNRKDGLWKMEYHSNMRDRQAVVDFVNGRVQGKVNYRCVERDYLGRANTTVLAFSVNEGHVMGEISGSINGKKFEGLCDEDGRPDGQWKLTAQSDDNTLSHVDCEMWSHGKLLNSYSEMTKNKNKTELHPYVRKTFSEIINNDLMDMLFIVRRGTHINRIEMFYEK